MKGPDEGGEGRIGKMSVSDHQGEGAGFVATEAAEE